MNEAEKIAHQLHNEEHAKQPGMVYQVWQDGEVTLQKSGELLWQRSLHTIVYPLSSYVKGCNFPCKSGENSYAFVGSKEEAEQVRAALNTQED